MRKLALCLLAASVARGAGNYYVGGVAGMATLSADGRSVVSANQSLVSLYKPENGPAVNVFFGRYLGNYLSVQANYIWNSNSLTLNSTAVLPSGAGFYQETRSSSQSSGFADLLAFFRGRQSLLRPYLSVGGGIVHLESSQQAIGVAAGSPPLPPSRFSADCAALRVAVGIDVRLGHGFSIRYSFSESISSNPIGARLSPPGQRGLKNFQNLWGFVKTL